MRGAPEAHGRAVPGLPGADQDDGISRGAVVAGGGGGGVGRESCDGGLRSTGGFLTGVGGQRPAAVTGGESRRERLVPPR